MNLKFSFFKVLLNELGFDEHFFNALRQNYLMPIAQILFPRWVGDSGLDSHKVFTVNYQADGGDVALDYHYDNAEVTMNVLLSDDFDGGSLYFGKMKSEPPITMMETKEVTHRKGWAVLHRGQQLHGALPIDDGQRHNIIMWMRSSSVRNLNCPMCDSKPVLIEAAQGFGDGFRLKSNAPANSMCRVL